MFDRILIANRGEIACRIIRTARRLGVRTVAVYSDADADALHVKWADEARRIGEAEAEKSYLNIAAIIAAAKASGAEAIHPGYGFLAENPSFACACRDAGQTFIGPPAEAMAVMGSKGEAKKIMEQAGIPIVPGYQGDDQSDARFREAASSIGYPVLIKASAGGGGKGMRIVGHEKELVAALAAARREAKAAFGSADLLLEKYLTNCRHVEVQVLADRHGNAIHLFERDCSIQRRYQKIIEEAPAPRLSEELRQQMRKAAVAATRAIDYIGAGTVECLVSANDFYFNEMNTRLQVEHPVTEMITNIDLVEWQLRVAAGEPLPWRQDELTLRGHAIEARLYAEDPHRDFLPVSGRITHLRGPKKDPNVRFDVGLTEGDTVCRHYDPLLAKLIVRGENRADALRRLRRALSETQMVGVVNNLDFLRALVENEDFFLGRVDTGFIDAHRSKLLQRTSPPEAVFALATLGLLLRQTAAAREQSTASEPWSPWAQSGVWRVNGSCTQSVIFRHGPTDTTVTARHDNGAYQIDLPEASLVAAGRLETGRTLSATIDGCKLRCTLVVEDQTLTLFHDGRQWDLLLLDPFAPPKETAIEGGTLNAPMPGRVLEVRVSPGERVSQGMPLLILEAMKMEHTITAPGDGTVRKVNVHEGDLVDDGDELLRVDPEERD